MVTKRKTRTPEVDDGDVPISMRVDLAIAFWREIEAKEEQPNASKISKQFAISKTTFLQRIKGGQQPLEEFNAKRQKLSPEEETALCNWILRLQRWGWPPRVEYTPIMAEELLRAKGDLAPLGVNWIKKFISRNPLIKSIYVPALDNQRALAEDPVIFSHWFDLFLRLKSEYEIQDHDVYNMDEKGFAMGVQGSKHVMINKTEKKKPETSQPGNREWVSLIECISMDGRPLSPWIIFKAKQHQKAWNEALEAGEIAISDRGWTDNEIGLAWLERCFDPETRDVKKGEYRMLLVDGHASHLTTQAIRFCINQKIILLCLPAHTTHKLQPLDVGIFLPLSILYTNRVEHAGRYAATHFIDKVDFIKIYQDVRKEAISTVNIQKAWAKSGLSPFKPDIILNTLTPLPAQLPEPSQEFHITMRPTTPPEAIVVYTDPGGQLRKILTPHNSKQIKILMDEFNNGKITMGEALTKVSNTAIAALAQNTIQNKENDELLESHRLKKQKTNRAKGHYSGNARFLGQAVLEEREFSEWDLEIKKLLHLGVSIFGFRTKNRATKAIPKRKVGPLTMPRRRRSHVAIQTPSLMLFEGLTPRPSKFATPRPSNIATPSKSTASKPSKIAIPRPPKSTAPRRKKLIVKLPIRVTSRELKQGLQARQVEQAENYVTQQLGRGMRTRKHTQISR